MPEIIVDGKNPTYTTFFFLGINTYDKFSL